MSTPPLPRPLPPLPPPQLLLLPPPLRLLPLSPLLALLLMERSAS